MPKKPQIEKFKEAARELGLDDDAQAKFDDALRKMASGTPKETKDATDEIADMIGQSDPNDRRKQRKK